MHVICIDATSLTGTTPDDISHIEQWLSLTRTQFSSTIPSTLLQTLHQTVKQPEQQIDIILVSRHYTRKTHQQNTD